MTGAAVGSFAEMVAVALGVGTAAGGALLAGAAADVAGDTGAAEATGAADAGWGRVDGAIPAIGGGVGDAPAVGVAADVGAGRVVVADTAPVGASGTSGLFGGAVDEPKANSSSESCSSASDCMRLISFTVKASLTAKTTMSPLRYTGVTPLVTHRPRCSCSWVRWYAQNGAPLSR